MNRRLEPRKTIVMTTTVSGVDGQPRITCAIRDANGRGCKLISTRVDELPKTIQMVVNGVERPIRGRIVWRNRRMAGVRFEWRDRARRSNEPEDWLDLKDDQ